jgi:predicted cupin superfamily sugar epimerase
MPKNAQYWIQQLELTPHPEGGYFRQTYRSDWRIERNALPSPFPGPRPVSTAIYFLLDRENFSAFHRIRSDELWHFYAGASIAIYIIDPQGADSRILLGSDPEAGEVFQSPVKAGCWFASRVQDPEAFALLGCTVAPGFDFEDFELAKRPELIKLFPQHAKLIEQLTRD